MEKLISVIVPVYNSEKYLAECIESLMSQSLSNIEFIFVNDGSKDNSLSILKNYQKKDDRIHILDQENAGPSAARNAGLRIAKGEYISFIDSDDWIDIDMYKEMYELAYKNGADVAICDMKIVKKDESYINIKGLTTVNNVYKRGDIEETIFKEIIGRSSFNSMANKLFRNDLIMRHNINLNEHIYYAEDWLFNAEIFQWVNVVVYIDKAFYFYRRGHESSSSVYRDDTFEKTGIWLYNKRKYYAEKFGIDSKLASDDLFKVMIHCIVSEFRRKDLKWKEKINNIENIIRYEEIKEMIQSLTPEILTSKEKYIYMCVKYNIKSLLILYLIVGRIMERR